MNAVAVNSGGKGRKPDARARKRPLLSRGDGLLACASGFDALG
jgi:hypothetical protein